jgi:hypothetical protein
MKMHSYNNAPWQLYFLVCVSSNAKQMPGFPVPTLISQTGLKKTTGKIHAGK